MRLAKKQDVSTAILTPNDTTHAKAGQIATASLSSQERIFTGHITGQGRLQYLLDTSGNVSSTKACEQRSLHIKQALFRNSNVITTQEIK
jgi:hypothetical protein